MFIEKTMLSWSWKKEDVFSKAHDCSSSQHRGNLWASALFVSSSITKYLLRAVGLSLRKHVECWAHPSCPNPSTPIRNWGYQSINPLYLTVSRRVAQPPSNIYKDNVDLIPVVPSSQPRFTVHSVLIVLTWLRFLGCFKFISASDKFTFSVPSS